MLLWIGLIIAVISTFTEIKLVHGAKWIDTLYTKGFMGIDGVYFNTAGSFILSWVIGMLFGATGLTVMLGGALSTGMSQMWFMVENQLKENGYTWESFKEEYSQKMTDFAQLMRDFWKVIVFCIRVITFPIWGTRAAVLWFNETKAKLIIK